MLSAAFAALALAVVGLGPPTALDDSRVAAIEARPAVHIDVATVPPETLPPEDTISEFMPEDRGLGDCLGLVERPGCGSEARGGWRQGLIFAAVVLAFAFIAWRIVRASRTARATTMTDGDSPRT